MNVWLVWMKDGSDERSLEGIHRTQRGAVRAADEISWFEPAEIECMEVLD